MTAPATIITNVSASVEEGNIAQVELFLNGEFVRTERNNPYVWNSRDGGSLDPSLSNLSAGTYELRAVATSSSGEQTEATRTITVISNDDGGNEVPVPTPVPTPAPSLGAFIESDGLVVVEMESLDLPSGWTLRSDDPSALGQYIESVSYTHLTLPTTPYV